MKLHERDFGFTIFELIATILIIGTLSTLAVNKLKQLDNPLQSSAAEFESFVKQVRARAISTTSAYKIVSISPTEVHTHYGKNCASTIVTVDKQVSYQTRTPITMTDDSWEICFNSRGLPDDNVVVTFSDLSGTSSSVEIFLGGAVRLQTE